ncbi:CAP domain-containing protein [Flavilitoribacter nigricans]|uniref:SCP domain-containing protein n=1 Tax=Flavilitoribacter nigricans (strain ATCC 23147 / DSM 23189 / NBRC 102662 / NCIMB 1420 / SS-2) TaxID=1122177 RepID=A0A2D0NCY7_FLAN2|nr:CAP domain-containing protein [Flavilitoribacter nigricans]PHN06371.1 hypothetical protein CRP01_12440 [Flavilitoribacter nigricans DSM 23189 = NBRC 102662]
MRIRSLALFLLGFSFMFTSCELEDFLPADQETAAEAEATPEGMSQMLSLVNELRSEGCRCGSKYMPPVAPLSWDADLERAALRHAYDMKSNDFFDHTGSDGTDVSDRVSDAGYSWQAVGENIAWGYRDIQSVFAGWRDSPGHCRNMMNGNFRQMGSARVGNYWVQAFARPRSS